VTTFVTIGNATQPFQRLLEVVTSLADTWPQPVVVQHGNSPFKSTHCVSRAFLEMSEFAEMVENARLLIMHAGAGSVLHALRLGKTPVVMPRRAVYREMIDDHQVEFSRALASQGLVILADEVNDMPGAVRVALASSTRPRRDVGAPRAVELVRSVLERYARR
jgi:beta-1,4-N-acetylglucosaminyltransferase